MNIRVTRVRPDAVIPSYGTSGSAAFDLTAAEETVIPPQGQGMVPIGLVFAVPEGHVMHVFARSSTFGKLGLMLSNGVGVIDADYRGPDDEVRVLMFNPGPSPVTVPAGTRIAQAIVYPFPRIDFIEGPADSPSRGGIGSTGGYGEVSSA
ncbi:dUTP diphosphatase [Candidatus Uhrbacteria bacterium]|nr:dUTP diphosphatase [Candidatus Uhrbacteria bacterium]